MKLSIIGDHIKINGQRNVLLIAIGPAMYFVRLSMASAVGVCAALAQPQREITIVSVALPG